LKTEVPTKTSNLTNDSNFITSSGAPVQSVNSKTGTITLSASDIKTSNGTTLEDVKEDFDSHKADYMYQIPVISGTQIRINRLSNTNRLFFQLSSDLTGGAITISTDGGTTSKPLQDVDGNAVTVLEKGFVEVVADATFFTLRNRGISATQKQQLIDITNNAEANQSTIKTNIATGLNTGTGSSLTSSSSWIDIQNIINNMNNTNKKYKIGTVTSVTTTQSFTRSDGTTNPTGTITITGLTFIPSILIAVGNQSTIVFKNDANNLTISNSNNGKIIVIYDSGSPNYIVGNSYKLQSPAKADLTSVVLPVGISAINYNYIAIE